MGGGCTFKFRLVPGGCAEEMEESDFFEFFSLIRLSSGGLAGGLIGPLDRR